MPISESKIPGSPSKEIIDVVHKSIKDCLKNRGDYDPGYLEKIYFALSPYDSIPEKVTIE